MNSKLLCGTESVSKNDIMALALLVLTVWVAHFVYFLNLGLYEDDYYFINAGMTFDIFLSETKNAFMNWPQGRPIGFFIPALVSFLGFKVGSLPFMYIIVFLIASLNAGLFYFLLRRISFEKFAVIGALAFCMYPADTTHTLLSHFTLRISLIFLLTACLCYLSGKRFLAYLFITACLLTYETPFVVFLAVPLLRGVWDRGLIRDLLQHASIMAGILIIVVVLRSLFGDENIVRIGDGITNIPMKIASAMLIGPMASITQFINAPLRAIYNWNSGLSVALPAAIIIFAYVLLKLNPLPAVENSAQATIGQDPPLNPRGIDTINNCRMNNWQLYLAGLTILCLAYVFSFTHYPPTASYGRGTSVHLVSTLGGSIIFALIVTQLLSVASQFRLRSIAVLAISLYLGLLLTYRLIIQQDFERAWGYQQSFWSSTLTLAPDMTEGTVIFVLDNGLPKTTFIYTNSWADVTVLDQLFKFPDEWANPPRLFVVGREWSDTMLRDGDNITWMVPDGLVAAHWEILPKSNLIVLEMEGGKMVRRYGSMYIDGLYFQLKSMPSDAMPSYGKGPLFEYLIAQTR